MTSTTGCTAPELTLCIYESNKPDAAASWRFWFEVTATPSYRHGDAWHGVSHVHSSSDKDIALSYDANASEQERASASDARGASRDMVS